MELAGLQSIIRGIDANLTIKFYSGGNPMDLKTSISGLTFTVRKNWNEAAAIQLSAASLCWGTSVGELHAVIGNAVSQALTPGVYQWSAQFTKDSKVYEAGRGLMIIGPDLT